MTLAPDPPTPAQIDLDIVDLIQRQGLTYAQAAERFGVSKTYAFMAYQRGITALNAGESAADRAQRYMQMHLAEIRAERAAVQSVINGYHVVVNNGHVVSLDSVPLEDQAPLLAAVDRMVKLRDQEAALLGIKAKTEINHTGELTYRVIGVTGDELT